ncbi:MAG: protein kinase [Acidobacteriia bacterium]|nr:protein kinase [Terriglobia bacterium]
MLSPDRWEHVERLFHEALARPPAERDAFVDATCGNDDEVRREVKSLLAAEPGDEPLPSLTAAIAADWAGTVEDAAIIGRDIDGYRILSHLGSGGMGDVFLAEDRSLGRKLAVKLLPAADRHDPGRLRRFADEARAASALNHPGILTVHRVGEYEGRPYIATELVDGETIRERLRLGALPLALAIDVAVQAGRALAAAHEAGIVHRDVKPENIMIRRDGYVKVLDFGVAKLTRPSAGSFVAGTRTRDGTRVGTRVGTLDYMAPEQSAGADVDARADIYSLAVVLYEMLIGSLPRELGHVGAASGSGTTPSLPKDALAVLRRGLATDPAGRPQTMADFLREVDPLRAGLRAPSRTGRRVAVLCGVTLVAVAGLAGIWWKNSRQPPAATAVRSLVILPFRPIAGDDQPSLRLGMAEAVMTRLANVTELRVAPMAAVHNGEDPFAVAGRLGVDAVLTGSVQREGDRLRVTAQLSRAVDHSEIWGARFDQNFTDIFSVQDTIAERITTSLLREVTARQRAALRRRETSNVDAYELYLKGHERAGVRTPTSIAAAIAAYRQAIQLDPKFAMAYAGLADAYTVTASGLPPKTRYPLAKAAAESALALDSSLPEAHVSLAYVLYKSDWNWRQADSEFQRAITLDPNYAGAYHQYGEFHRKLGAWQDAIADFTRAHDLEPYLLHVRLDLVEVLVIVKQFSEARRMIDEGLEQDPDSWEMYQGLSEVLHSEQRIEESVEAQLKSRLLAGQPAAEVDQMRAAFRAGGEPAMLRREINALELRLNRPVTEAPWDIATSLAYNYALLQDREQTMHWLDVATERGEEAPLGLHYPFYDFMRDDPRFQALFRRVGFP